MLPVRLYTLRHEARLRRDAADRRRIWAALLCGRPRYYETIGRRLGMSRVRARELSRELVTNGKIRIVTIRGREAVTR